MKKILIAIFAIFLILGLLILGRAFSNSSYEKLSYPMAHQIIDSWQLGRLQNGPTGEFICILVGENSKKEEVLNLANYYKDHKKYKYLSLVIANNKDALNLYLKNEGPTSQYLTNRFIRKHLICTIGVNIVDKGKGSFEPHKDDEIIWRGINESANTTIYERQLTEDEIKIQDDKLKGIDYEAKYKKMVSDGASMDMIIEEMKKDKLIYASQVLKLMDIFNLNHEKASKIISESGTPKP